MTKDSEFVFGGIWPLTFYPKKHPSVKVPKLGTQLIWTNEQATRIVTSLLETTIIATLFLSCIAWELVKQRSAAVLAFGSGLTVVALMLNLFSSTTQVWAFPTKVEGLKKELAGYNIHASDYIKWEANINKQQVLERAKGENVNGVKLAYTSTIIVIGIAIVAALGVTQKIPGPVAVAICMTSIITTVLSFIIASVIEKKALEKFEKIALEIKGNPLLEQLAETTKESLRAEHNILNTWIAEAKVEAAITANEPLVNPKGFRDVSSGLVIRGGP